MMTPDAGNTIKAVHDSGLSPEVQMLVILCFIAFFVIAPGALWMYRQYKGTGSDGAKSDTEMVKSNSEASLYRHLAAQVAILTGRLDSVHDERNKLIERVADLSSEVRRLQSFEAASLRMQAKLDEKDAMIGLRDKQINELFSELRARNIKIEELMEKLHALELRVQRDERQWNAAKDDGK